MSNKRPEPGTKEFDEWIRKRTKAMANGLFGSGSVDFDERGIIFGNDESVKSSDSEAFPDDIEEYCPEEKKPRLVHKKKGS